MQSKRTEDLQRKRTEDAIRRHKEVRVIMFNG